ncbi:type II toxin-antitoxin system RelE/ParE family toxin [Gracilibacillus kekensis]|uniref:Addiction module toxin, RelE/StbE family n=1 Tax=Gracilibacillus kekensis TaxID=1027249 RepID=A0A1M7QHL0_9BACI|nr:type II toxin-antitoxin system RelE/ParE family toxin [Gracilibacillus kekensis]SHN30239.1 addiction module toxin, RelE/StbE family [Gracilibacillus kekensis]
MEKGSFSLKITAAAKEDMERIYRYIVEELYNEQAADDLMETMENIFLKLVHFPFHGSYVKDKTLLQKGYRKLIIHHYIGFYLVNERKREVIILRVLYGKREYRECNINCVSKKCVRFLTHTVFYLLE